MNILPIITDDGSPSFRNIFYDEPYHSKSGGVEEAFKKYALPLKIWEKENPIIFDVCFGIGYNAAAAIDLFLERGQGELTIYCFENDIEILKKCLDINPDFKNYGLIQAMIKGFIEKNEEVYSEKNVKLIIKHGDARLMMETVEQSADFVFFDPFSPKKHPEMWTSEFFKIVYEKMNPKSILSTYSYARIVRDNLKAAGFTVSAGPTVGRRSPSTIATKN
jgi:tRNA U34 5-methylaminomethyl-2-thiouridine-forming methyltransferase MnmC